MADDDVLRTVRREMSNLAGASATEDDVTIWTTYGSVVHASSLDDAAKEAALFAQALIVVLGRSRPEGRRFVLGVNGLKGTTFSWVDSELM